MSLDLDLLPKSARALVEAIGEEHALAVIKAFGGRPLYVPNQPTPELIAAVGEPAAVALCRVYSSVYWGQVPKCHKAMLSARNRALAEAFDAGKTITELAREYGLCWVTVHQAIKQGRLLSKLGTGTKPPNST